MAGTQLVSEMYVPATMTTGDKLSDILQHDEWMVDGVQVTQKVYEFCKALRNQHAFRHCLFGVDNEWKAANFQGNLWVYAPDELFARGQIGYGDVGVTETIYKYYVETEQIRNYKVKSNRRQFNMTSSDSLERMVVASKKHLRPYPTTKIVDLTAWKLTASLSDEKDATSEKEATAMGTLESMLTRNGALTAELGNMVKVDYEFKDESVKEAIVAYMDTIDNDIEVSSRNVSITLVLVHPPYRDGTEHGISVQRSLHHVNLKKRVYVSDVERAFNGAVVEKYTPDTLPKELMHKISSLNILPVNSYVNGLGLRQSENIYYLAEDA